jgi:hypothetical protein
MSAYQNASVSNLTTTDLEAFAKLKVSPELLEEAGIRRVSDREARDAGILRLGDMEGILFPYMQPTGEIVGQGLRRDHPEVDSTGRPKAKYVSSFADKRHSYILPSDRPSLQDINIPSVMVEAEKSKLSINGNITTPKPSFFCHRSRWLLRLVRENRNRTACRRHTRIHEGATA